MTKLITKNDIQDIENIILDIVHIFNQNYGNNVQVSSEFDIDALLNTVYFNLRDSKTTKVDTYDFYNVNSYVSFNDNIYSDPVKNQDLLDKLIVLQNYCGTKYTSNPINYSVSHNFVLLDDDMFHPSKVSIKAGKVEIYGTVNRELLKTKIEISKDNKLKITGGGTELFEGSEETDEYSNYNLQYLKELFDVIGLKINNINYEPFYPVITVTRKED